MPVEMTQTSERDKSWDWWMKAMLVPKGEKPKKYYLIGFPDVRDSDIRKRRALGLVLLHAIGIPPEAKLVHHHSF